MSYHICLNSWAGEDQDSAASKMAKVFRMDELDAFDIVRGLSEGNAWQFQHPISNQQSEIAENFLTSLGFDVERRVVEAQFDFDDLDDDGASEAPVEKKKNGMFGKVWSALTKKR